MTALSKEEFRLLLSNSVASTDLDKVQDAIADLVAENERLKSIPMKYRRMAFNAELQDEADKLRTALAAAEADNERLRDDFKCAANYVDFLGGDSKNYRQSIAQPSGDSALREMIAGAYEECAKVCDGHAVVATNNDGAEWSLSCSEAIRALAEKAKGE